MFADETSGILTHSKESVRVNLWSEKNGELVQNNPTNQPIDIKNNVYDPIWQPAVSANENNKHKVMLCSVIFAMWWNLNGKNNIIFQQNPFKIMLTGVGASYS